MMQLNNTYNRDDLLKFLEDSFLADFKKDIRPANTQGSSSIQKAYSLGRSESFDLQVFEFSFEGSPNKRVSLTKDAFQIMKSSAIFRALAIFHSPDNDDWRLSLMTATPERTEKGKVSLSYSNPKRLSFFLGPNAKINTPTKFLINKGKVIDFEDLKNRFSIEVVNKEFYKEISQAFAKLVNGLLKLPSTQDKSQTNLEFAVRLIGRIIFCWFLREKKSQAGMALMPKELLSFEAVKTNENYYHKILEPIFFEILNKTVKSRRDDFTKEPFSSVPYLNGGLFSPQEDDYYKRTNGDFQSQYHNTLVIPDNWIKDFFEILETYNFTIDENTSYDEELSIDPEMLGRIFENLLAEINPETGESARKSTGSYYTPRTIVNYMIDESLLLYLKEQTGIAENKLRAIISYDLDDDLENPVTVEEKEKIIDALEKVKILDPACGSGAFPIGALQKIVFILQQTDPEGQLWFKKQIQSTSPEIRRIVEREFSHKNFDYIRKLGIIRENIYGVDIQSIATEISRLRCFLTLIVDERIQDEAENRGIEPLPNLDFKFVTANSLIGLPKIDLSQQSFFDDYQKIDDLKNIRDQYFNASGLEREQLKTEFVMAQKRLVDQLIKEHGFMGIAKAELTQKLTDWEPFTHKSTSWFDSEWMFGIKSGFDLIIGNPPYIQFQKLSIDMRSYLRKNPNYESQSDIWFFFVYNAYQFLADNGILNFIVSNYFLDSAHAKTLRSFISKNFNIEYILDFRGSKVFDNASINTLVFHLRKTQVKAKKVIYMGIQGENFDKNLNLHRNFIDSANFVNEKWIIANDEESLLLSKINENSTKLGSISQIGTGIKSGDDDIFVLDKHQVESLNIESAILKKWIKNSHIDKYSYHDSNLFVIYTHKNIDIDKFPNTKKYLSQHRDSLTQKWQVRGENTDYWKLYRAREYLFKDENYELIICPYKAPSNRFCVGNNITGSGDLYVLKLHDKNNILYVLGILNSKLGNWINSKIGKKKGNLYEYYTEPLSIFPIKNPNAESKILIKSLVTEITNVSSSLILSKDDKTVKRLSELEKEIDQLVYKLYNLTPEEIAIVEGKQNN